MKYSLILKKLKNILPSERFAHSLRVVKIATALALYYNIKRDKVAVAALLHDCSRFLGRKEMLKEAESLGLEIDKAERKEPKLLHAKLSEHYARQIFSIKDEEILSAIRSHTVGNTSMSLTDKIVYLADHIEEKRNFKEVERIRRLAFKNLDRAVAESLDSMIKFIGSRGLPVSKKSLESRDALKNG